MESNPSDEGADESKVYYQQNQPSNKRLNPNKNRRRFRRRTSVIRMFQKDKRIRLIFLEKFPDEKYRG